MRRMRRAALVGLVVVAALAALLPGIASAGNRKLVEGTVYDTTCATACTPECPPPPHCGPIPTARASADIVCAQRRIVCPLAASPRICLQGVPCGGIYPVYSGEGATVNVRRRGSATVIANLPVVEGHFKLRLGSGAYVIHPYLPEEPCWSGIPVTLQVSRRAHSPVLATVDVSDGCVAHPDAEVAALPSVGS
jgi:hypothetical protein